jgi:arylsulfatase A-like enzyme
MVVSLDDGVGRVLQALDDLELAEDTLLIFLTDHGGDPVYGGSNKPLRGDKATLFDGGLKVPCVMRWPGKITAGRVSDQVASSLDLFPTFCELAGGTAADNTDGISLVKHLVDGAEPGDRELFWETGRHAQLDRGHWQALRQGRWKYVHKPDGSQFLFDLTADPNEVTNLADSRAELVDQLEERCVQLAEEYRASVKSPAGN